MSSVTLGVDDPSVLNNDLNIVTAMSATVRDSATNLTVFNEPCVDAVSSSNCFIAVPNAWSDVQVSALKVPIPITGIASLLTSCCLSACDKQA